MNKQLEHLKRLDEISHTPVFTLLEIYDDKTKQYHPGNKHSIGKYQLVDHRTVSSNEVIFELDFSTWSKNLEVAKRIVAVLQNRGWHYYAYASGGKGIHLSIYFDRIVFEEAEHKALFKEALMYRLTYKNIRFWLWRLVLEEAGLYDDAICGDGLKIDSAPINFNEETAKTHPIRICGGRKKVMDKVLKEESITYKTFLSELPKKKPIVTNIDAVNFPETILTMQIDINEFTSFIHDYIQSQKDKNNEPLVNVEIDSPYTELESVKKILEGVKAGRRAMGARIVAIACYLDGFSLNRCNQVMRQYVDSCSQIGDPFTIEEAERWAEWIYGQQEVFWSCGLAAQIKVHDELECAVCQARHKETNKVLGDKNVIKRIDDFLAQTIVGEKKNRILTFLLLLSSRFIVDKQWNVLGDPKPASVIFSSMSASGKTWLTKQLLPLFGKEGNDYYTFSRMTKTALNYFADVDMNKKILFTEELQGLDAESNQLRLWISEGSLKLASVEAVKQPDGTSTNQLLFKKTIGQPVFITGTAEDSVDEQMNNRSWLISLDISEGQNKRILDFEDKIARGEIKYDETELRVLQDSIKMLKPYHFIIPYYDFEILNIPTNDVRIRRDYSKFRYIICCVALLHQRQRIVVKDEESGREFLVCNLEDYEIAKHYSEEVLQATFSGLTKQQIELLQLIKQQTWATEFEIDNVQRMTGWSQSKTYMMMKQLEEIGVITSRGHKPGVATIYAYNNKKQLVDLSLPSKDNLRKSFEEKRPGYYKFLAENGFLLPPGNENTKSSKNRNSLRFGDLRKIAEEKRPTLVSEETNRLVLKNHSHKLSEIPGKMSIVENTQKDRNLEIESVNSSRLQLAGCTTDTILKFMEANTEMITTHEQLEEKFGDVEDQIITLKAMGDIYETKPGKYVVLK